MSIAVVFALLSLCVFCGVLVLASRRVLKENSSLRKENTELAKDLKESLEIAKSFKSDFEALQNKFRDNPSYECQQLLADLLMGNALFRIERLSPENILLRRG